MSTASATRHEHYYGGAWHAAASGRTFPSYDPSTGEPWYDAARGDAEDVDRAVRAAAAAFESEAWRRLTSTARGHLLRRLGDLVVEHAERLAHVETHDNGKLLREMRGQMGLLPEYLYYFAGIADKVLGDVIPGLRKDVLNYTLREPVGVVAAIAPWNSPLVLTTMKLAPAIAAGNTIVIKPSEHTSASILALMPLIEEAGFPPGAVNVVTGYGDEVGAPLISHPLVAKVAFTGGSATGRRVAVAAAERIVPVTLELGGKSPNIVFPDADLDSAAAGIAGGIFAAGGQTCVAGSRVFLHRDIHEEVLERVVARARAIRVGDPFEAGTEMGPLALAEQLAKVERYVDGAVAEGATIAAGGARVDDQAGWYYAPTVLTDVENTMKVARDEIFGPVAGVLRFSDEDEVVALANDTPYGLAAGVWTRDVARAHRVAGRLDAGTVWVNMYRSMAPMSPLGGFKESGIGKENGFSVMHAYTREKSVWVNIGDEPAPGR